MLRSMAEDPGGEPGDGGKMRGWVGLGLAFGALAVAGEAWAIETATPGGEPAVGWRDAITLGIAVLGALLGFLNIWIGMWRDRRKKVADGTYLALRLAVVLEAYASDCSEMIQGNMRAETKPDHEFPDWNMKLPEIPPYVDDNEGWRALDPEIAGECLDLRNRAIGYQSSIYGRVEFSPDDGEIISKYCASKLGLESWDLAVKLRKKYRLKPIKPIFGYHHYLRSELDASIAEGKANPVLYDAKTV